MPTSRSGRGGPKLPYEVICGVEPCPGGWLLVSAKLQGNTLAPQAPEVIRKFSEILDYRPAFVSVALHLPIGLPNDRGGHGRRCDREARQLLKWPRASAIASPPTRNELSAWQRQGNETDLHVSAVTRALMPRIVDAYEHIGSYHQRTVFEVHPELSFFRLNRDQPLRYSKRSATGIEERTALLQTRIPGIDRSLAQVPAGAHLRHVVDACATLWSARLIAARAVTRLPDNPEWDAEGLRMELVR